MAWTTPRTWVAFEVPTAAIMNTHIRDNLNDLDSRSRPTSAALDLVQSTTSTSYTNLATVGPSVTVVTGQAAVVIISAQISPPSGTVGAFMSFAVSGATTLAASDANAVRFDTGASAFHGSCAILITGLTPGSNTFTTKYRSSSGHAVIFSARSIIVWPGSNLG